MLESAGLIFRVVPPDVDEAALRRFSPERIAPAVSGIPRHLGYVCVWALLFGGIYAAGGVGDDHPGQWLPFWQQACGTGNARACAHLEQMETTLCRAGSGWACNELGNTRAGRDDAIAALASWQEGCDQGFEVACRNADDGGRRTAAPTPADQPLLLRGSKGPIAEASGQRLPAAASRN